MHQHIFQLSKEDPEECLKVLNSPAFLRGTTNDTIISFQRTLDQLLTSRSKQNEIILALYCYVLLRRAPNDNPKVNVEFLSALYRNASTPKETKQLLASLMLHVPSFTNYKQIIRDLTPNLVPTRTLNHHVTRMVQQCPNLFEELKNRHRHTHWYDTFSHSEEISLKPLIEKVGQLRFLQTNRTASYLQLTPLLNCQEWLSQEMGFLSRHARQADNITIQPIKFIADLQKLLADGESSVKAWTLDYLGIIMERFGQRLIRVIRPIYRIIQDSLLTFESLVNKVARTEKGISILKYLESICRSYERYIRVFGLGFAPHVASALFVEDYSFLKLMECFLYNNYERKAQESMNHQKGQSKMTRVLSTGGIAMNDHWHQILTPLLSRLQSETTERELKSLISSLLSIFFGCFFTYFRQITNCDFGAKVIEAVENGKYSDVYLQGKSRAAYEQFKDLMAPRWIKSREGVQEMTEDLAIKVTKRKRSGSFPNEDSKDLELLKIRKTVSFNTDFEGWDNVPVETPQAGSEMFFSIKESKQSLIRSEQVDQQTQPVPSIPSATFSGLQQLDSDIVTPEF